MCSGVGIELGIILNPFFSLNLPREVSIYDNHIIDKTVNGNDNGGTSTLEHQRVIGVNTVDDNGHGGEFPFPGNGVGVQNLQNAQPVTRVLVSHNEVHGNGDAGIGNVVSPGERDGIATPDAA